MDNATNATFTTPDLTTFCRLDDLDLVVTGQQITAEKAVLACRPVATDDWCHRCGCHGSPRDTVVRELAHVPFGWRPTTLQVRLRLHQCTGCGHVWRHTRRGDKCVTVVIDLTPVSTGTGPSRSLAMVEGRSKQAFKTWLAEQPQAWRDGIRIVAMDGFAASKQPPQRRSRRSRRSWTPST